MVETLLAAAVAVHRELGPGLLESAYEAALCYELRSRGIAFERQVAVPLRYRRVPLGTAFRADLIVADQLLVELKCIERLAPMHVTQVLTYLRLLRLRRGFLLNFQHRRMCEGIHRVSL